MEVVPAAQQHWWGSRGGVLRRGGHGGGRLGRGLRQAGVVDPDRRGRLQLLERLRSGLCRDGLFCVMGATVAARLVRGNEEDLGAPCAEVLLIRAASW